MWDLLKYLWNDEVGSSQSTEMALVTGVTIGALVMSMRSFGHAVNNRFEKVEVQDDSLAQLEIRMEKERREKERDQQQRLSELRRRRQEQLEYRERKAAQHATTGDTAPGQ